MIRNRVIRPCSFLSPDAPLLINNLGGWRATQSLCYSAIYKSKTYYMDKKQFKKIDTFEVFCKSEKRINEGNVPNIKVEVEWWNDAIKLVMAELHTTAGDPIDWSMLVDFCRAKFMALSRELPLLVENMVLAHIRDLIFQYYGSTLFTAVDLSGDAYKTAALGTKLLVISRLGEEILGMVKIEAGLLAEPEEPEDSPNTVASVSLADDDYYYDEEVPFENKVYGCEQFGKLLNEIHCHLQMNNYNSILDKCLKDLKPMEEAGVLDYKKVLKAAKKNNDCEDEKECIDCYLTNLVKKHFSEEQIELNGTAITVKTTSTKHILKAARNLFIYNIVEDLKGRFKDEKVK